ncbi:MAG: hypothetical protein Q9196_006391, partial [Gyalolechia fulgens]
QNFFTGWSSGPPSSSPPPPPPSSAAHAPRQSNHNLKTPALGLVWTNQLACRIALIKEHAPSFAAGEASGDVSSTLWKRYMKVVFAAWGPSTGVVEKGVEFEIWGGGMRAVVGEEGMGMK